MAGWCGPFVLNQALTKQEEGTCGTGVGYMSSIDLVDL